MDPRKDSSPVSQALLNMGLSNGRTLEVMNFLFVYKSELACTNANEAPNPRLLASCAERLTPEDRYALLELFKDSPSKIQFLKTLPAFRDLSSNTAEPPPPYTAAASEPEQKQAQPFTLFSPRREEHKPSDDLLFYEGLLETITEDNPLQTDPALCNQLRAFALKGLADLGQHYTHFQAQAQSVILYYTRAETAPTANCNPT